MSFSEDPAGLSGDLGLFNWTYCNYGHVDLAHNWWKHFDNVNPGSNPVIVTIDNQSAEYFKDKGAKTVSFDTKFQGQPLDATPYKSGEKWSLVTAVKIEITHELLRRGITNFYTDPDIVIVRDPFADIPSTSLGRDLMIQINDQNLVCSGVYLVKPNPATMTLFDFDTPKLESFNFNGGDDQDFLNARLHQMSRYIAWGYFPQIQYPTGNIWYRHKEQIRDRVILIHYNCVIGKDKKIQEMLKDGNWHDPLAQGA